MEVAVLHPRDCLNDLFSTNNNVPSPHRHKKPVTNRRRRSPPPRHQTTISPPSLPLNHAKNPVRILKRGNNVKIPDLAVEKPDLKSNRRIGTDPVKISTPIRVSSSRNSTTPGLFYAGTVTSTSPPPSEVPLPAFFAKKSVSVFKPTDPTNDLIRILRLDIA